MFKYLREERGQCRTMYRSAKHGGLYALVSGGRYARPGEEWEFYVCTRDGEPNHQIAMPAPDEFDRLVYPSTWWRPRPSDSAPPAECEQTRDPDHDCGGCVCWRQTRANCS